MNQLALFNDENHGGKASELNKTPVRAQDAPRDSCAGAKARRAPESVRWQGCLYLKRCAKVLRGCSFAAGIRGNHRLIPVSKLVH